ncbi:MAG: hypothetical protein AB7G12_01480 [Thermoanaerobaculia bacterium]
MERPVEELAMNAIEQATAANSRYFWIYLIASAVAILFGYLSWKANNRALDAVRIDASSKIVAAMQDAEYKIAAAKLDSDARIEEAKLGAAQAQLVAAATNERSRALELQVAEQRERAAAAETKLLILAEDVAPRVLLRGDRVVLVTALRELKERFPVTITVSGGSEAAGYAAQIQSAFQEAGWEARLGTTVTSDYREGMGLFVNSLKSPPKGAALVQAALRAAGIDLSGQERELVPDGEIEIEIANKPRVLPRKAAPLPNQGP